ncbi:MAG: hypothetical protein JRJ85_28400 [Deltaproteobacteria bacterium]|nr:hypothetical protein [Deltaproteobacteria bacterium]
MKITRLVALMAGICFGLSIAVSFFGSGFTPALAASKSKPIELKFAHHNPPKGRTTVKFLDAWMRMAEKATNGKVKIISYPAQSLAKSREMVAAIEGGVADMGWTINGVFAGRFPLTEVMYLPFLALPSAAKNGRIINELYDKFPALQKEYASMKLLGMYEGAEKGVIDGAFLNWAMLPTFKLYEVFRYWTNADILPAIMNVSMNLDKWNSLPPDVQQGIMSVSGAKGAEFAGRAGWGPEVKAECYAIMKKKGKMMEEVKLDPGEIEKWRKVVGRPVWNEWAKQMEKKGLPGQSILDEALRLREKYR